MIDLKEWKLSDFDFTLPESQIAKFALPNRTEAKLIVLDRKTDSTSHKTFSDIADYFEAGDVLVLNNTKVLPARIFAKRETGAKVEVLLLEPDGDAWQALLKPSGRIKQGEQLITENPDELQIEVLDAPKNETGMRKLKLTSPTDLETALEHVGHMPLPPYIDRQDEQVDRELYQTVFAKNAGAVASPTAGLHFDDVLLCQLRSKGVEIVFVTLHVSYGTFQPVQTEDVTRHEMYYERYGVTTEAAERINLAKQEGRRITCCGTTAVRTLEAAAGDSGEVIAGSGRTNLFIYPPYKFKIPDRLITNFHLPKSTLLMLASAFAGYDFLMKAYEEAVKENYRFYSYGDAMLIL